MSTRTAPRVLVADPLGSAGLTLLRARLEVLETDTPEELRLGLRDSAALVVRSRTQVTADLLASGPQLRIIGRAGIGVDNIDVAAATERGILVINAPLGNVRSTAEHTVGLLFALARRIPAADLAVRDGRWKEGYAGVQLAGKRLGVIGAGKVGRQVALLGAGIGMDVVAYDPYLAPGDWQALGITGMALDDLLHTADFVTIHVPLAAETRGLIDAPQLARMKPGAYLLNCARGGLVDETALAAVLTAGHLAGAALDVFAHEPLTESPLLHTPNTILTPHIAASTREAQAQVSTDIAEQILDFFAGRPVGYPVNPAVLRKDQS